MFVHTQVSSCTPRNAIRAYTAATDEGIFSTQYAVQAHHQCERKAAAPMSGGSSGTVHARAGAGGVSERRIMFYPRCDLVFHNDPRWWSPNQTVLRTAYEPSCQHKLKCQQSVNNLPDPRHDQKLYPATRHTTTTDLQRRSWCFAGIACVASIDDARHGGGSGGGVRVRNQL